MGIFSRIANIIKANINDLLDRAEDPEKVIKQALVEMKQSLREAKVQVAAAIRDKKKLEQKYQENVEQAEKWERRAMVAIEKGEEDLAKEALRRKKSYESLAENFKDQLEEQTMMVEKLKKSLSGLEAKIEEAERKKDILLARKKRAEAKKKINETISSVSDKSAFSTFDRMEEKISNLEARADAESELTDWEEDESLEDRFESLEKDDVEDELEALKRKLGKAKKSTTTAKTVK
jgi:phage shock protein A